MLDSLDLEDLSPSAETSLLLLVHTSDSTKVSLTTETARTELRVALAAAFGLKMGRRLLSIAGDHRGELGLFLPSLLAPSGDEPCAGSSFIRGKTESLGRDQGFPTNPLEEIPSAIRGRTI